MVRLFCVGWNQVSLSVLTLPLGVLCLSTKVTTCKKLIIMTLSPFDSALLRLLWDLQISIDPSNYYIYIYIIVIFLTDVIHICSVVNILLHWGDCENSNKYLIQIEICHHIDLTQRHICSYKDWSMKGTFNITA